VLALLPLLLARPTRAQDLRVGINDTFDPAGTYWAVDEVGWFFTPISSFTFNEIRTVFHDNPLNPTNGQPILFELRERLIDSNGISQAGPLLRSTTFGAATTLAGGTFADFQMLAGETYFLGFRGVLDLGVNVTGDGEAVAQGNMRFSFTSSGTYSDEEEFGLTSYPIMQLWGADAAVPEPGALALVLPALFGLPVLVRRRSG
jgi:hypothetical protein